jgi:hypothetical protein
MTHHQNPLVPPGQVHEFLAFFNAKSQGLLNENIFSGEQGLLGKREMLRRWGGDYDGLNIRILQQVLKIAGGWDSVSVAHILTASFIHVIHSLQSSKLVEIPDEILAPVTATNNSDPRPLFVHWTSPGTQLAVP